VISVASPLLRRSIGLVALPALLALVLVHIYARGRLWSHEWLWGFYNYHFLLTMLGPIGAGLGAWEGFRLSRASDLLAGSGRTLSATASAWAALMAWLLVAYGFGLSLVVAHILLEGSPVGVVAFYDDRGCIVDTLHANAPDILLWIEDASGQAS
jgi:hypothetical protein